MTDLEDRLHFYCLFEMFNSVGLIYCVAVDKESNNNWYYVIAVYNSQGLYVIFFSRHKMSNQNFKSFFQF